MCVLSIYVAFDFPKGKSFLERLGWRLFRLIFPAYIHDVLWNHAMCELKHSVESAGG